MKWYDENCRKDGSPLFVRDERGIQRTLSSQINNKSVSLYKEARIQSKHNSVEFSKTVNGKNIYLGSVKI
jgi:hypothetical protein